MLADARPPNPPRRPVGGRIGVACVLSWLVAAVPAAAAPREWVLARSPGFIVVSDAGEKRARQVAHQFEQVRALFRQVLQARVDPGRLVVIIAVKDESGLRELLPGYWERKGGAWPAGIFVPGRDKHLLALRLDVTTENPYRVVYHEYTHLLIRLNVRWVPLWLNEGLAEFWGSSDIDDQETRWGLISGPALLYLRQAPMVKLDDLLAADQSSPLYNDASRTSAFYAQSTVLTHYLLLGAPERRGQIAEFFKQLESGVDEPEALRRAFGDLRKLDLELSAYVQRMSFPGVKTQTRIDAQTIQAMPLTPAQADALRGDFLARTGRPCEARALLDSAVRQDPEMSWAHEGLGTLEAGRGRRPDALRQFNEAARLAPANYLALFRAGLIEEDGAEPKADAARREQALRKALQVNPAFAPALAALARLLSRQEDRRAEAVSSAQRACALDPAAASHRVDLWQALSHAGQAEDAARVEEELVRMARHDRAVLAEVVGELDELGRSADAEGLLRKARAANPRSSMVSVMLAGFLDRQEKADEAERILRGALAADPQSVMVLNSLAYTLADSTGKPDEALTLIDRALKKAPNVPEFLDTRGWTLYKLKRLPEAETVLRSAAEGTEHSVILEHLGDVLLEQGRRAEALAEYERALEAPDVTAPRRATLQSKIARAKGPAPSPAP